ncbi:hypothetical protein [Vitiosangium sp. GDMCC 1.1324]|uniref:hypothetical protein n=1 Tax=Vitiosangium sp. (strain GDMCC 1.1324) TaxID=2138576 RepID=UPI000D3944AB|nr:hypothetical protein [Vitiosangium sp. GDMCC 1.1324]PTL85322.1 hypothetical protein DAT35_00955 [Vitiosangium sp. GDMCC 1.1324]
MVIRLMSCGVLIAGAVLFGTGCRNTAEAQNPPTNQEKARFCGGIAAIPCPEGYVCVDDPSDDCDPNNGGADCGGLCQKAPDKGACDQPERSYVSRDPNRCAAIRFVCDPNKVPFFDDCGCGCEPAK